MAGILLEDYKEDEECPGRVTIKKDGEEEEEYSVEEILSKKKEGGVWVYHIKWYRWPHKYNTWEPASNLTHCKEKLAEFEKEWNEKKGSKKKSVTAAKRAHGGDGQDVEDPAKKMNDLADNPEVKDFDKMWLGEQYSMFRRKWKPTEEPLCVVGSAVHHNALLHVVLVRVKSPEENVPGTSKKMEGVAEENTVIVLSKMFGYLFPQILIAYYESRLMAMDNLKSKENLLRDAARAGLMHNLMGAKVNANYKKMFEDMMPPDSNQGDKSSEKESYEYFPKKNQEDEDEVDRKKKVELYKNARDKFGLPYYYGDEVEGFGSEEEYQSDDSDEWEEEDEGGVTGN